MNATLENQLKTTALAMGAKGKGLLAADESTPTITRRLAEVGVTSTPQVNNAYRDLLLTAPNLNESISGVILVEETLGQSTLSDGIPYPEFLEERGILPGIKVDKGAIPIAFSPEETVTEGLDGLRERLNKFRNSGARFTKWRAVITMDSNNRPTANALELNAHALARYAALAQEAGLVPICEPEVLMEGDHHIERSHEVTASALDALFIALKRQGVLLEGIILKPNMVLSGYDCAEQASHDEVASRTLDCLKQCVPVAVPSIHFLSGGQSEEDATIRLNRINQMKDERCPWLLSFSFARALQHTALRTWRGEASKVAAAQSVFLERARATAAASLGQYQPDGT